MSRELKRLKDLEEAAAALRLSLETAQRALRQAELAEAKNSEHTDE